MKLDVCKVSGNKGSLLELQSFSVSQKVSVLQVREITGSLDNDGGCFFYTRLFQEVVLGTELERRSTVREISSSCNCDSGTPGTSPYDTTQKKDKETWEK